MCTAIEHKIGKGTWKRLTALQTPGVYGFGTEHHSKQRYRVKWTRHWARASVSSGWQENCGASGT